jgi:hypothetical protein
MRIGSAAFVAGLAIAAWWVRSPEAGPTSTVRSTPPKVNCSPPSHRTADVHPNRDAAAEAAPASPERPGLPTAMPPAEDADSFRIVALLLQRAHNDLEAGRFPLCRRRLDRLDRIDPAYPPAQRLRALLEESAIRGAPPPAALLPGWGFELDSGPGFVRLPERQAAVNAVGVEEGETQELLSRLKSLRVSVDFNQASVDEVMNYLREISGLPLELDFRLRSRMPRKAEVSLKVGDIVLDGAIRLSLQRLSGPVAYDTPDGRILITAPDLR